MLRFEPHDGNVRVYAENSTMQICYLKKTGGMWRMTRPASYFIAAELRAIATRLDELNGADGLDKTAT